MIDEAHVLLSPEGRGDNSDISAGSSTVSSLQRMLKEIRAYGTGVIIADQSPSKVTHDIIAARHKNYVSSCGGIGKETDC